MTNERITEFDCIIDDTCYMFDDERLSKQYLKHLCVNSGNINEVVQKIKLIQDRVSALAVYANFKESDTRDFGFEKHNHTSDNGARFEKIDNCFNDENSWREYGEYLKSSTTMEQLNKINRQCAFIHTACKRMAKQARCYHIGLKQHEITAKSVSEAQLKQRKSVDSGIFRSIKAD